MPQTKEEKRTAAEERQKVYDKLTLEEKLELVLRSAPAGPDTKQIIKLRKQIEEQGTPRKATKKKPVKKAAKTSSKRKK